MDHASYYFFFACLMTYPYLSVLESVEKVYNNIVP